MTRASAPAAPFPDPLAATRYTNPVYDHDFPDPFVLEDGGHFYAYATHSHGFGFQGMDSRDLVHWTHRGTVFTVPWSRENYWAPEVVRRHGWFYMTYSARNPTTGKHDIGIAAARTPLGPFVDRAILVRGDNNRVGVIDATLFFEHNGMPYLIYSEEAPRRIVMRRMARDLMSVEGDPIELVRPDRPEEHGVTEAPTLIRRRGLYHLFFSAGRYQSNKTNASYAVYHAVSRSLRGPYRKDPAPLLKTVPGAVYNPGHQCILRLRCGEWWIIYHGWDDQDEPRYGSNPAGRTLRIDHLRWNGDVPLVDGPTSTPQPAPCIARRRTERRPLRPSPAER